MYEDDNFLHSIQTICDLSILKNWAAKHSTFRNFKTCYDQNKFKKKTLYLF